MEDKEAADAEATETFEEGGNSLFNCARIGAPLIVISLPASKAALASASDSKATNQVLVALSKKVDFGRIASVVKANKIAIGLTSDGRSITATKVPPFKAVCCA